MWSELEKIAGERSDSNRHALLRQVTDVYLRDEARRTSLEVYLFHDMVDKIVRKVATLLPPTLAAGTGSPAAAEATRQTLSRADAVAQLDLVARQPGCETEDMPEASPDMVQSLSPLLAEAVTLTLAERGIDLGGRLPPLLLAESQKLLAEALRDRQRNARQTAELLRRVAAGTMSLAKAVGELAAAERIADLAALLARALRLPRDEAFRHISQGDQRAVLVLLRAIELPWPAVESVLALRAKKRLAPYVPSPAVRREYEAIRLPIAQRVVRFLKVRRLAESRDGRARQLLLRTGPLR